jgi:hypothetical protein
MMNKYLILLYVCTNSTLQGGYMSQGSHLEHRARELRGHSLLQHLFRERSLSERSSSVLPHFDRNSILATATPQERLIMMQQLRQRAVRAPVNHIEE